MLERLEALPPDPILDLSALFAQDSNPNKVNLGIGVYRGPSGITPIFESVKTAERQLIEEQTTKAYVAQAGDPSFLDGITKLVLGDDLYASERGRVATAMTPGGSGALRMLADMIKTARPDSAIWVPTPTWGNHVPLLSNSGLELKKYPYYSAETGVVNVDAMLAALRQVPKTDVVLLHGCCHNPSGADLSNEDWEQVIALAKDVGFTVFIDIAYQGFASSLDDDAFGVRLALTELDELLVAASCSKNFGVYRERAGMSLIAGPTAEVVQAANSHILSIARRTYSMSAYHGGGIVGRVLSDDALRSQWEDELTAARNRVNALRASLAKNLNEAQSVKDFGFIAQNKGMFSLLGLTPEQVQALRSEFGIYVVNSSRINVAGVAEDKVDFIVDGIAKVLTE